MPDEGTKQIPQNIDAEISLLGSLLVDKDAIVKIADKVKSTDFYDPKNQKIFAACERLYNLNKQIDVLTLADELRKNGDLDAIGGPGILTELTNFVPTAANVEQYGEIVADKALRRRLIKSGQEILNIGGDEKLSINETIESAETALFNAVKNEAQKKIVGLSEVLTASFDRLDELHKNKESIRGVSTGYRQVDNLLAGLQKSDLIVLAARPSMGKTALALNIAHNIALKEEVPILIFSLEMSKEQLVDRLLAAEAGVNAWNLRTGNLSDSDFEKIGQAMGSLSESKIYIDDTPSLTVNEMRTRAKRENHRNPLGLIVVDYLQLMSGGTRFGSEGNRVQEISEISRGLKGLARELNLPVLAISQLSRSVESRSPQIPQLADLRESGSIEQDADVVAFIYREEYYNPDTERKNITDLFIKKHRNGPTGAVELYFDRDKQQFRGIDTKHTPQFNE